MGFKEDLQEAAEAAFNEDFAEVVEDFTATRMTSGEYDPVTDKYASVPTNYTGKGVTTSYASHLVDGVHIKHTDKELLCLASHLTDVPAIGDQIGNYEILHSEPDPAGITYTIQLREIHR